MEKKNLCLHCCWGGAAGSQREGGQARGCRGVGGLVPVNNALGRVETRPWPGSCFLPPPRSFDFALSQRSSIVKLLKGSQCGPGPGVKASVGSFEEMFSFTLVSSPSDCVHFCCPGYALRIPPSLARPSDPSSKFSYFPSELPGLHQSWGSWGGGGIVHFWGVCSR